ncbi:MAG TPA: CHAD domain-containing protein [Terriglobales bacterium]|nr:CHAD domain-containing protein [Terriglobales bacterium]
MDRAAELYAFLLKVASGSSPRVSPRAVHGLRTASRRLQSLFSAAGSESGHKLHKQLRKLRRQAGKVRDLDVQIAALKSLQVPAIASEQKKLLRALQRRRRKSAEPLREFLGRHWPRLRKSLQAEQERQSSAAAQAPRGHRIQGASAAGEPLVEALAGFAAAAADHPLHSAEDLHAFRIAVKKARYAAELATPDDEAAAAIAAFKRIQDAIGEWHDWALLASTAEEELGPPQRSALVAALNERARRRLAPARRIAARETRLLLEMHSAVSRTRRGPGRAAPVRAARAM